MLKILRTPDLFPKCSSLTREGSKSFVFIFGVLEINLSVSLFLQKGKHGRIQGRVEKNLKVLFPALSNPDPILQKTQNRCKTECLKGIKNKVGEGTRDYKKRYSGKPERRVVGQGCSPWQHACLLIVGHGTISFTKVSSFKKYLF